MELAARVSCKKSRDQIRFLTQWAGVAVEKGEIHTNLVIEACDRLSRKLDDTYLPVLEEVNRGDRGKAKVWLHEMKTMLGRPWLEEKVGRELGDWSGEAARTGKIMDFMGREVTVRERRMPLGVLFHIGAGNMEGLSVYSVIEGLLAGNVNIVKTAEGDGGFTAELLDLLIAEEPALADYIYLFDVPSTDLEALEEIGRVADGIVVWGGDEAVRTVRRIAPANVRIIEWGHKTSFCYVTKNAWKGIRTSSAPELLQEIRDLASHICLTNQIYCDSCQGIYLDAESRKAFAEFGRFFLKVLEETWKEIREKGRKGGEKGDRMLEGRIAYQLRCLELERDKKVLRGDGCSVTLYRDSNLEPSLMYRNCWVKMLSERDIVGQLKGNKNHLHTAGLICLKEERTPISEQFLRAGVIRVSECRNMGLHWAGEPHDGEFPLMQYSRVVAF